MLITNYTMRIVAEITDKPCRITIFNWNNKYILKLEYGNYEQTYKVAALDLGGDEDIKNCLSDDFINKVMHRFMAMENDLMEVLSL
ncbi:MAG: hypothetical protein RL060_2010 [Bacteroidota bacterium]